MAAKSKIAVEIVRSTAKAHLIKDAAGREGWIQRRWLAADGTVSESVLAKAAAHAAERKEQAAAQSEAAAREQAFRNATHRVRVVKETERAVAAEVVLDFAGNEQTKLVWFPKSAIGGGDGVAEIAGWMIRERELAAIDAPSAAGSYERHRWCKGERAFLVRGVEILNPES